MKKKQRPATEIQKEQEPVEKRQSEVSKHEDGVVKKDTKKDKRLMEAFRKAEDHRRRYQSPQKKQKDRAIDKRPVLVF